MRILQTVTMLTPDDAYGGPVRVALNTSSALRARGHTVQIAAGAGGYDHLPESLHGVPAKLFKAVPLVPGTGFSSTWAIGMRRWIVRAAQDFDLVHVHLGRDLVMIPTALELRRLGVPYICQTHGMIRAKSHPLAGFIDRMWVVKLLRDANRVLCLNERERLDLLKVAGSECRFELLPNGVPLPGPSSVGENPADTDGPPEVLFLARLNRRKHPEIFAEAALSLLRMGVKARFSLVGPKDRAAAEVDKVIAKARREGYDESQFVREPGLPLQAVSNRMWRAAIYVLPAAREPFGLTVAEALTLAVPVVIRGDGGLADFVRRHGCGLCVDGSVDSVVEAIGYLLSHPDEAADMGRRGAAAIVTEFGIDLVVDRLERIYEETLGRHDPT